MVWALFPTDSLSGEDSYYLFAPGKYTVGRKGCDIIITKDKGVSRVHAEIVVDAMISFNFQQRKSSRKTSKVRIIDCSKYGTYINKNVSLKEKIHDLPNKEASLNDGDVISFGTGSASYRFSFVPLVFYTCQSEPFGVNQPFKDNASSIGARIFHNWTQEECTHVLVDECMPLTETLVDAIMAKKPIVLSSWIEHIAGKRIETNIPSFDSFFPTLKVERKSVKVVDPNSRENCLSKYMFLLDSIDTYKYGDQLQLLLQNCGGKNLSIEEFRVRKREFDNVENNHVVCVIPGESAKKFDCCHELNLFFRIDEVDLMCAILSGQLDPSSLIVPSAPDSSSCSTQETVVEESDLEVEMVDKTAIASTKKPEEDLRKLEIPPVLDASTSENVSLTNSMEIRRDKIDESEIGNIDIIYTQDLIVRRTTKPSHALNDENSGVVNFKLFKKTNTQSGNSFYSLIPFSKNPYKETDHGSEELAASLKEEKRRKQMEAIAEDLFNNEKGRQRGTAGTIKGLLTRA